MKRTILACSTLLIVYWTCLSLPGQAQDAQDIQKSCRRFVQSFYDWYVQSPDLSRALKDKRSALSPTLARALNEDEKAQAKSPGEIAGLDWDPFLSGNDNPPGERYVMNNISLRGDGTCWVELHRLLYSEDVVAAEVAHNDEGWHFVNFYYRFPKSTLAASVSKGGLLTILKNLREARQKAAREAATPVTPLNSPVKAPKPGAPASKPTPSN
jgi:hypothetical protein